MNIEEAKNLIQISEEEKNAIENYIRYNHTGINLLSNLTPELYQQLSKSWDLPQKQSSFNNCVDIFVNLYSAMYKHFRTGKKHANVLYRGTSKNVIEEVEKSGSISRFISTSTDKNRGKSFIRRENPLLLEVEAEDDVPFLDIEQYRDKREQTISESEILFSPFCGADIENNGLQFDSYLYKKVHLKKPQFIELSSEEVKKLEEKVTTEFEKNINNIRKYNDLSYEIEMLQLEIDQMYKNRPTQARNNSINVKEEEIKQKQAERESLGKEINEFRENLQTLLQAKCRQKELEIDEAYKSIDEEQKPEFERIKENIKNTLKQLDSIRDFLLKTFNELKKKEKNYRNVSENLGIDYNIELENINNLIININRSLHFIESIIEKDNILDMEYSQANFEKVKELEEIINTVSSLTEATVDENYNCIIRNYENDSLRYIKEELGQKVQSTLRSATIKKYSDDIKSIKEEKIGFLGKITGKEKNRQERLKNANIKLLEYLSNENDISDAYISVRQMLVDIYVCAVTEFSCNKPSEMPEQLKELYLSIRNKFGMGNEKFSDQFIIQLAQDKIAQITENRERNNENLPATTVKSKTGTKKELIAENASLTEQIDQLSKKANTSMQELFNIRNCNINVNSKGLDVFYNIALHIDNMLSRCINKMQDGKSYPVIRVV